MRGLGDWLLAKIPRDWLIRKSRQKLRLQRRTERSYRFDAPKPRGPIPPVPDPTVPCGDKLKRVQDLTLELEPLLGELELAVRDLDNCLANQSATDSERVVAAELMSELTSVITEQA